jgi:hypothetical protein
MAKDVIALVLSVRGEPSRTMNGARPALSDCRRGGELTHASYLGNEKGTEGINFESNAYS